MGLNLLLRTLTAGGFTTKGAELTWIEGDTNFIKIGQAIDALQSAPEALILQGGYACAGNPNYPTSANTLLSDNPQRAYAWYITTAGNLHGIAVSAGQLIFAKIDNAGATNDADWVIVDSGLNFTDLFKTWAMSLPGYSNTVKRVLTTTGGGADTFEWSDFQAP